MNFSGISSSRLVGRIIRWPLCFIPHSMVLRIIQGKLRGYRWVVGAGNHGYWLGSYEYGKQCLFTQAVGLGAVVYDIGANVGFYTLLAAEVVGRAGRVIAFEPLPRNLHFLHKHISLNHLLNVDIIEAAVSDKRGVADFDGSCNPSMGKLAPSGSLKVRVVSLDEMVMSGAVPPPHFIKIDVEGAEDAVLHGSSNVLSEHRPTIFLSTHGDEVRARCLERLLALGYHIETIADADAAHADEFVATFRPAAE
jgi:FkbM family methyltransferase